jgi:hypothetical protein
MMHPTVTTALVHARQSDLREQADQARLAKLALHGSRRPRIVRRPRWWHLATQPVRPHGVPARSTGASAVSPTGLEPVTPA